MAFMSEISSAALPIIPRNGSSLMQNTERSLLTMVDGVESPALCPAGDQSVISILQSRELPRTRVLLRWEVCKCFAEQPVVIADMIQAFPGVTVTTR